MGFLKNLSFSQVKLSQKNQYYCYQKKKENRFSKTLEIQ